MTVAAPRKLVRARRRHWSRLATSERLELAEAQLARVRGFRDRGRELARALAVGVPVPSTTAKALALAWSPPSRFPTQEPHAMPNPDLEVLTLDEAVAELVAHGSPKSAAQVVAADAQRTGNAVHHSAGSFRVAPDELDLHAPDDADPLYRDAGDQVDAELDGDGLGDPRL